MGFQIFLAKSLSENRTLIAYATKGGTTEEYANAIASVLRDGLKMNVDLVDLMRNHDPDLTKYRNVIVGTGVRMQRVYGDGVRFLEKDFGDRKVAIYITTLEPREDVMKKYVEKILQQNTRLKPFAIEVCGGRMRFLGRTSQDQCDIGKAKEWARSIAPSLEA
jgi:menaquinone-dependent protoporphyrinogen IX oxidase